MILVRENKLTKDKAADNNIDFMLTSLFCAFSDTK